MGSWAAAASSQMRTSFLRIVLRSSMTELCHTTASATHVSNVCRRLCTKGLPASPKQQETGSHHCGVESNCWSCGACVNNTMLFCGKCEYIQPLHGEMNLFELLKMPQSFDLETPTLESNFKRLQKSVHPDLFGYKTKREQDISAEASSRLNVAYKVLLNPITRAQYLLQLHGIDAIGEAAGSAQVDGELLLQVMEAREQLEDPTTTVQAAQRLRHNVARSISASITDLSLAFRKGDLKQAADITVALQYFTKLKSECDEWLAQHNQTAGR